MLSLPRPPLFGELPDYGAGRIVKHVGVVSFHLIPLHAGVKMQYDWILDVLDDLKSFAKGNGLPALAEQLDDTSLLAAAEIAQFSAGGIGAQRRNAEPDRAADRGPSAGENAG
jgi:hypothetical protein